MTRFLLSATTALLLSALPALAHGVTAGALEIIHPAIPLPANGAKTAAGYFAVVNGGDTPDRLIAVETPIAKMAMVHITETDANGVSTMRHLEAVDLPAGETVVLEPGGMHVMLMGLTDILAEGDMIPATLVFEQAGRVEIEFSVDPAGEAMDHSQHGN